MTWSIPGPRAAPLAISMLAALLVMPSMTSSPARADAGPSEWVITSLTTLQGETRELNTSVVIENGGELRLVDSALVLNGSREGALQVLVKQGGKLSASRSNITWGRTNWHYWFLVNGTLDLQDTAVRGVRGQFDTGGIYLSPTSGATISRCHFSDNQWYSIIVNGSSPTISDCDFSAVKAGIRVENGGTPTISGNSIGGAERQAIISLGAAPVIRNNRITGGHQGIDLDRSKATITGNEITGCQAWGIQCYDFSDATITGNAISGCAGEGISVVASAPTLLSNVITDNGIGVNSSASTATLTKNTIGGSRGWGVLARSGAPTLSGNTFEDSRGTGNTAGDVAIVWSLTVLVEQERRGPVAGANISIIDGSGKTVFRGRTGEDGTVAGIELYQYTMKSGARHSSTPHKITVSKGGLSSSSSITMDRDQTITAKLVTSSSGFIPGPGLLMVTLAGAFAIIFFHRKRE